MSTPFERSAREWLRAGADGLDARTRSRLNRARQAALAELDAQQHRRRGLSPPLLAACGAAAVALAVWWLPYGRDASPSPAVAVVAAIDDTELAPVGGEGMLDADPTLFALASSTETAP